MASQQAIDPETTAHGKVTWSGRESDDSGDPESFESVPPMLYLSFASFSSISYRARLMAVCGPNAASVAPYPLYRPRIPVVFVICRIASRGDE